MPSQHKIEQFTLAFHRVAVQRLRERPELIDMALKTLDRWASIEEGDGHNQRYRLAWRRMLGQGAATIEAAVCTETDEAATLRSASPLGFVLTEQERTLLRASVVAA